MTAKEHFAIIVQQTLNENNNALFIRLANALAKMDELQEEIANLKSKDEPAKADAVPANPDPSVQ